MLRKIHDHLFDAFGPQHWWPGESPFEVMVGAILTQNTNWGNVERAIANLKAADALTPKALAALTPERLATLIRPSGYFNIKARRLLNFMAWLMDRTGDGDVANLRGIPTKTLRTELIGVRGVGPETADSMLLYALRRRVFVVDAYTRRFMSRHGLIDPKASYEAIREQFESNLPKSMKLYNEFHALIVALGNRVCRPKPRCEQCPLRPLLGEPTLA